MALADPRFQPPRSAYVHVPFCRHRCGYCNFTLVAGRDDLIESYLQAVSREMSWLAGPHPVDTLYLGGGTPTHLSVRQLESLLDVVQACFPTSSGTEFSVEANPADVSPDKLRLLQDRGVNRISLGVQSFADAKLRTLERDHRRADVERAYRIARAAVDTVSLDLIFAAPSESLDDWETDLRQARRLQPDHVSTYSLTYERGTHFWSRKQKGQLDAVDETTEQRMYERAIDHWTRFGYEQYEISSFARPGRRCRHNEVYWTGRTYYAVGPGAARHVAGRREVNHRSTTAYIRRVLAGQSPLAETESLPPRAAARERLIFGLRRLDGVDRAQFLAETGYPLDALCGNWLQEFARRELIEDTGDRVRLTRAGILLSDSICERLLNVEY